MNKIIGKSLGLMIGLSLSGAAFAQGELPRSTEQTANISSVFIPPGFGTDEPFAVVSGLFPNSCWSWKRSEVKHLTANLHEVRAMADVRAGMCLMVIIPYTQDVALGRLDRGAHTLRFMNGDGTYQEKQLTIE